MININLVPASYRNSKGISEKIPIMLILLIVNVVLLAMFLIVTSLNVYKTITLRAVTTRLKDLDKKSAELVALEHKMNNLKTTNSMIEVAVVPEFLWSQVMNDLSDAVIPGVWMNQISMNKQSKKVVIDYVETIVEKRFLKIEGTVVSIAHDEMAVVSGFIRKLKKNEKFFALFEKMELESVLRRKISTVEVMDFTLLCHLGEKAI